MTQDDECNLDVHLYAKQGNEINLSAADCSDSECIQDWTAMQEKIQYPGAWSLDYPSAMEAVCECLRWYYKKNCCKLQTYQFIVKV